MKIMSVLNLTRRKSLVVFLMLILLLAVAWLAINKLSMNTIEVRSADDAVLFVATEQDGEWSQIGVGTATYTTSQKESLFFQATRGDAVSQISIDPTATREEPVVIGVEDPPQEASKILEGPLTSTLVEDDTIYGINSNTHSLVSASLEGFDPAISKFIGLPYMENIVWKNSDNFFYRTYSGDVGVFSAGEDRGYSSFGSKGPFIDVERYNEHPIAFLSIDQIYLTPDFNQDLVAAASVDLAELYYFNTDDEYVYYATFAHPGDYASDTEDTGGSNVSSDAFGAPDSQLKVLDYDGNTVVDLPLGQVSGIGGVSYIDSTRDTFVVASDGGLDFVSGDSENIERVPIYSSRAEDVIATDSAVYLFMPDGIWRYDIGSQTMFLATTLQPTQSYVPDSAVKSAGESSITFTITGNNSGVYELGL